MKLTVFGATGRTGKHLVAQALDAGHEVVAFARTPARLGIDNERLSVVQGDLHDAERVAAAVAGADAVLNVAGPTSQGTTHILAAMQRHGVRRLLQSIGAGIGDANDAPGLFHRAITVAIKLVSRSAYDETMRVAALIRASDLDWTLVRAPMLTDQPRNGDIKVGYLGKGTGPRLSRADLAAFMLRLAEDGGYVRQAPVVSN